MYILPDTTKLFNWVVVTTRGSAQVLQGGHKSFG